MEPVRTENTNAVFMADGCNDLPGTIYTCDDGISKGIETCWEISEEELEQIIKSRRIFVYMVGCRVSPMFLSATSEISKNIVDRINETLRSPTMSWRGELLS